MWVVELSEFCLASLLDYPNWMVIFAKGQFQHIPLGIVKLLQSLDQPMARLPVQPIKLAGIDIVWLVEYRKIYI